VAEGAAFLAALIQGHVATKTTPILIDVTAHDIGLKVRSDSGGFKYEWVVKAQSSLPLRESLTVTNELGNEDSLDFLVYENGSRGVHRLGELKLSNLPRVAKH
jgi:hypothetical protein